MILEKKDDPEYNPPTNFSFEVQNKKGNTLTENFGISIFNEHNTKEYKEIKMNEIINKKADEIRIILFIKCKCEN